MNRKKKKWKSFAWIVVIIGVAIGLFWLLAPDVSGPGADTGKSGKARRSNCQNRMRNIVLSIEMYRMARGHYPPAVVYDETGKPMHSWRALILPFMEAATQLSNKYDFKQPWDSPNNLAVAEQLDYDLYFCPALQEKDRLGKLHKPETKYASYVFVTGPGTAFDGDDGKHPREFKDGLGNSLLLIELADSDIQLLEPRDITAEEFIAAFRNADAGPGADTGDFGRARREFSRHAGGFNAGFADCSTRFIERSTPPETIRALTTIAGGEVVGEY